MQRLSAALVLLACFGMAGCGQSASQKLPGKWKYDLKPSMVQSGAVDGNMQVMLEMAEAAGVSTEMVMEFKDDRTVTMSAPFMKAPFAPGSASVERRWKVTEVDGDKVTVEISVPDSQKSSTMQITFVDDDHFEFNLPAAGGKSLVFSRVKQE